MLRSVPDVLGRDMGSGGRLEQGGWPSLQGKGLLSMCSKWLGCWGGALPPTQVLLPHEGTHNRLVLWRSAHLASHDDGPDTYDSTGDGADTYDAYEDATGDGADTYNTYEDATGDGAHTYDTYEDSTRDGADEGASQHGTADADEAKEEGATEVPTAPGLTLERRCVHVEWTGGEPEDEDPQDFEPDRHA